MGVLVGHAREQVPCALCGKEAYQPRAGCGLMAMVCRSCGITACCACATQPPDTQGISVLQCPRCRTEGLATYLDPTLVQHSIWTMPPQSLDGWPALTPSVYAAMNRRVQDDLPMLQAALAEVIAEKDLPAVVERLRLALATGKYLEWCSSRREDVRRWVHSRPRLDFEAPSLASMIALINSLIAPAPRATARVLVLEDDVRRQTEMLAVLRETYPDIDVTVVGHAAGWIRAAQERLPQVSLVCLDHDLEPPVTDPTRACGDGREVVRWLVSQPHRVPVLLHTANSRCGSEMERMLHEAGWQVHWTPPFDDLAWVRATWMRRVAELLEQAKPLP